MNVALNQIFNRYEIVVNEVVKRRLVESRFFGGISECQKFFKEDFYRARRPDESTARANNFFVQEFVRLFLAEISANPIVIQS